MVLLILYINVNLKILSMKKILEAKKIKHMKKIKLNKLHIEYKSFKHLDTKYKQIKTFIIINMKKINIIFNYIFQIKVKVK